jgi:hypothetical protein
MGNETNDAAGLPSDGERVLPCVGDGAAEVSGEVVDSGYEPIAYCEHDEDLQSLRSGPTSQILRYSIEGKEWIRGNVFRLQQEEEHYTESSATREGSESLLRWWSAYLCLLWRSALRISQPRPHQWGWPTT